MSAFVSSMTSSRNYAFQTNSLGYRVIMRSSNSADRNVEMGQKRRFGPPDPCPLLPQKRPSSRVMRRRATRILPNIAGALIPHASFAGLGGPDPFGRPKEFQPNQAFMGEIGPSGRANPRPPWRMNGGYCLISTSGAPRHLCGKHPIENRLMAVIN